MEKPPASDGKAPQHFRRPDPNKPGFDSIVIDLALATAAVHEDERRAAERQIALEPIRFGNRRRRIVPHVGDVSVRSLGGLRPPALPDNAIFMPTGSVMRRVDAQRPEREQRRRELLEQLGKGLGISLKRCFEQDTLNRATVIEVPQLIAADVAGKNEPAIATASEAPEPEAVEWPVIELDGNFSGKLDIPDEAIPARPSADISTMTPDTLFGRDALDYTPPPGGTSLFQSFDRAAAE